jgi:hypothetical protein
LALRHPLTLASIGLLLLNDHWLKAAYPSTLTGKLSDFAGLFFFPFILTALIAWPAERFRLPRNPSWLFAASLGLTGGWFAALKLLPGANALHRAALGALLGGPVSVALDPTDLLALASLPAAAWLWGRVGRGPAAPARPGWRAYLALGLGTLASLATSPARYPLLMRATVYEGQFYIGQSYSYATGYATGGIVNDKYAASVDGLSWSQATDPPPAVATALAEPPSLSQTRCLEQHSGICFRITGAEQIERSSDGGQTWLVDWRLPPGRKDYMERACGLGCVIDARPKDLAILENGLQYWVVAPLGQYGLLARQPDGQWQWVGALDVKVETLPTQAGDPLTAFGVMLPEIGGALLGGLALSLALSAAAWLGLFFRGRFSGEQKQRILMPALWLLLGPGIVYGVLAVAARLAAGLFPGKGEVLVLALLGVALLAGLIAAAGYLLLWLRLARAWQRPRQMWSVQAIIWGAGLALWVGASLLALLWALGAIPWYPLAMGLALGWAGLCLLGGLGGLGWLVFAGFKAGAELPGQPDQEAEGGEQADQAEGDRLQG